MDGMNSVAVKARQRFWRSTNDSETESVNPTAESFCKMIDEAVGHSSMSDEIPLYEFVSWASVVYPGGDFYDGPRCPHCHVPVFEAGLCEHCEEYLSQFDPAYQYKYLDFPIFAERGKRRKRRLNSQVNRPVASARRKILPCQRTKIMACLVQTKREERMGIIPKHIPESLFGPKGIKRR